jgi:hypothetical protein
MGKPPVIVLDACVLYPAVSGGEITRRSCGFFLDARQAVQSAQDKQRVRRNTCRAGPESILANGWRIDRQKQVMIRSEQKRTTTGRQINKIA